MKKIRYHLLVDILPLTLFLSIMVAGMVVINLLLA